MTPNSRNFLRSKAKVTPPSIKSERIRQVCFSINCFRHDLNFSSRASEAYVATIVCLGGKKFGFGDFNAARNWRAIRPCLDLHFTKWDHIYSWIMIGIKIVEPEIIVKIAKSWKIDLRKSVWRRDLNSNRDKLWFRGETFLIFLADRHM